MNNFKNLSKMNKVTQKLSDLPYFSYIRVWGTERGIIIPNNEITQVLKLYEEFGELCGGVLKQNELVLKDSIGDMVVVLTNLSGIVGFNIEDKCSYSEDTNAGQVTSRVLLTWIAQEMYKLIIAISDVDYITAIQKIVIYLDLLAINEDLTLDECIEFSWSEIEHRTGRSVNGNFIKD